MPDKVSREIISIYDEFLADWSVPDTEVMVSTRYGVTHVTEAGPKDGPVIEALDDPGRRRIHGVAAQSLSVALLVVAANVRKIRLFLAARTVEVSTKPRRPRRRKTTSIAYWRPLAVTASGSSDPDPPLIV